MTREKRLDKQTPAHVAVSAARSASQSSFDDDSFSRFSMSESQDQAREREEHVAVLEYELRKANDTIEKLRARLTSVAAEEQFSPTTQSSSLSSVPLSSSSANATVGEHNHLDRKQTTVAAKSFEKRTINYLINEFLRDTGRKMAAITFANEVFFFLCTSPRGYSLTHCLFFFLFFFFPSG